MNDIIYLEKIYAGYKGLVVLKNINMKISRGLIVVLGPNGSGKSTLFKIIAGLLKPLSGEIRVLGLKPFREIAKLSEKIFYLPEKEVLPANCIVEDAIDTFRELYGSKNVDKYLELFNLSKHLTKRIGELSQGYRRRLHLIEALSSERDIILLDEPFRGLDSSSRALASEAINYASRIGKSCIIVSTHIISRLSPEKIFVIEDGNIKFEGKITDLEPQGCIVLEKNGEIFKICGDRIRSLDLSNTTIKTIVC
ncbi:MAG: ABC transporter ATP-binding protein [Crenarchaeota archaeon]|nr:ABC transporter ATP-binding protein [Thermoproteota archaeon]